MAKREISNRLLSSSIHNNLHVEKWSLNFKSQFVQIDSSESTRIHNLEICSLEEVRSVKYSEVETQKDLDIRNKPGFRACFVSKKHKKRRSGRTRT